MAAARRIHMRNLALLALATFSLGSYSGPAAAEVSALDAMRARLPQDEVIYFLLPDRFENGDKTNDRGGLKGNRLKTGFDPASKGFYNGGDFKGVMQRLDYIQSLGATAVWLAPVFKNKPVQGDPGQESAGYHGYWITDFTHVDPHFGTDAEFKTLVDAVHARGMKFYMDIVINHTADVIQYKECRRQLDCPYRSRADYPYSRLGGVRGAPINDGFLGDNVQTEANFARLTNPSYAYTPYVPKGEEHAKTPDWLNDPIYYHNRGNSTFSGENSTMGDFSGLDDLMTENPRVVRGMIDIFAAWIDKYRIDGFRIDTEKHVNSEFWRAFIPAMQERAKADGISNFHIFGEIAMDEPDVAELARHTREDKLPSVLDFGFAKAVKHVIAGSTGTDMLARVFADDSLYEGGAAAAAIHPTFVSNHDQGRVAWFVRAAFPQASDEEVLKRVTLAHAMMFTMRGVPTVYYGDEQGFAGIGNDMSARADMFPSKVKEYNDAPLVGTKRTTATSSFTTDHPLYGAIRELSRLRAEQPALRRGRQIVRAYSEKPGLMAISRIDSATGREIVIAYNTSVRPVDAEIEVDAKSQKFAPLHGKCVSAADAPGSYHVSLQPLDYVICSGTP
jgi:glycosidase